MEPSSGRVWWLLLPTVNTAVCSLALAEFAAAMGLGPEKRIVLQLDGAGWHRSGKLTVPEGLDLVFQPPVSPELQPAERLWPLVNEALANRSSETIEELEDVLVARCRALREQPAVIAGYCCYHWWPRQPAAGES
ncbi:MAG: transposase [Gammaproteobacteria bacterium]|nr:transposase [Gammaproteobacteria bacterium]